MKKSTPKIFIRFCFYAGFWILSLLCEIPFYFLIGSLVLGIHESNNKLEDNLEITCLIGIFSLFYRVLSFHLLGSWLLKRFLIARVSNPLMFGFADFILANLWVGIWALVDPRGPTSVLFGGFEGNGFPLSEIWFVSILPIGLGSMTFQLFFGNRFSSFVKGLSLKNKAAAELTEKVV